jgi:hypothetical protein
MTHSFAELVLLEPESRRLECRRKTWHWKWRNALDGNLVPIERAPSTFPHRFDAEKSPSAEMWERIPDHRGPSQRRAGNCYEPLSHRWIVRAPASTIMIQK